MGARAAYIAISRLPWLTELAAWGIGSTWTRGMQFVEDRAVQDGDEPDLGDLTEVRERYGLRLSRADSFAVERRARLDGDGGHAPGPRTTPGTSGWATGS